MVKYISDTASCLQERLKAQKAEAASNPEYGSTYKPQTSKEDRTAKRKQILSNIGMLSLPGHDVYLPSALEGECVQRVHVVLWYCVIVLPLQQREMPFAACHCPQSASTGRSL